MYSTLLSYPKNKKIAKDKTRIDGEVKQNRTKLDWKEWKCATRPAPRGCVEMERWTIDGKYSTKMLTGSNSKGEQTKEFWDQLGKQMNPAPRENIDGKQPFHNQVCPLCNIDQETLKHLYKECNY